MARWNDWWWAPDEWRMTPGMDDEASLAERGGGGGGGAAVPCYKAADPGASGHEPGPNVR